MSSISDKIMSFLKSNTDWSTKADGNNDGIITANEFYKYLDGNTTFCTGADANDEIYAFFKKFDAEDSNKKIKGTTIKDYNALKQNEIEALQKILDGASITTEPSTEPPTNTPFNYENIQAPSFLTEAKQIIWKAKINLAIQQEQFGPVESLTEDNETLVAFENKLTLTLYKEQALEEFNTALNIENYSLKEDSELTGLLGNISDVQSPDEIKTRVDNILNAYLETAGIKIETTTDDSGIQTYKKTSTNVNLDQTEILGSNYSSTNENKELTPLQKAKLKNSLRVSLEAWYQTSLDKRQSSGRDKITTYTYKITLTDEEITTYIDDELASTKYYKDYNNLCSTCFNSIKKKIEEDKKFYVNSDTTIDDEEGNDNNSNYNINNDYENREDDNNAENSITNTNQSEKVDDDNPLYGDSNNNDHGKFQYYYN